jgi:hypothetical protein
MKKLVGNKRGQFVIIAVLLMAVMIISLGALMNRAVTYYKHEPWEEYLTLIGNIELSSNTLVELSLTNYTNAQTPDVNILKNNLDQWQINLTRIYPGQGVSLNSTYCYITRDWNKTSSFSNATVSFTLNVASIGLTGYKFTATAFLNLTILSQTGNQLNVTVKIEGGRPLTGLGKENFRVSNSSMVLTVMNVTGYYDQREALVYTIQCNQTITTPITVSVWDLRGIQVVAKYP